MAVTGAELRKRLMNDDLATPILDIDTQLKEENASLDVRLGHQFIVFNKATGFKSIDATEGAALERELAKHHQTITRVGYGEQFHLHPGDFVIARTFEYISMPADMFAYVLGRSSWGRLGLVIATATFVNPNFRGTITLEIANLGQVPINLIPLTRIAQLAFHKLDELPQSTAEVT